MKNILYLLVALMGYLLLISGYQIQQNLKTGKVQLKKTGNNYYLTLNNQPYFIKGAGGDSYLSELKKIGGNSIRTWTHKNAQYILDEAHKQGLTVTLGLDIGRERLGFNYNDQLQVLKQYKELEKVVIKYKNHPALLMWCIGNEVAFLAKNEKVWEAIEDIALMIKKNDGNHPTTTTIAGVPADQVKKIMYQCPHIDIISVNAFEDLPFVPIKLRQAGWQGPYIISEWGANGYWESKVTSWNAVIEQSSTQKAELIKKRYESSIKKDQARCLGSYVFYWGHKQERTHTFFGLFGTNGEKTAGISSLEYLFTEKVSEDLAPEIFSITIDQLKAEENIFLDPKQVHQAIVLSKDPENEKLTYKWEIYRESTEYQKTGGDYEIKPSKMENLIEEQNLNRINFKAPIKKGPYRLFVSVFDTKNNLATANIPFYVK